MRQGFRVASAALLSLAGIVAASGFLRAADPPRPKAAQQQPATDGRAPPADQPSAVPDQPANTSPSQPPKFVLEQRETMGILGEEVRSPADENMGRIVDVIVDRNGHTPAAVIDFGGFLGVGSRKIAVDWNALHFAPGKDGERITLEFTREQVKSAPEYRDGQPVVVLGSLDSGDGLRVTTTRMRNTRAKH